MKRAERWLVVVACAAVGWFYFWTVESNGEPWNFGEEQRDYYNLLIDGYLDGQLHMKVEVPQQLLALKDPYDPNLRPAGLGMHDASFYKGKYYVYFGAAPLVVLMLPFRLLTGTDLPLGITTLVFVYGGFLASAVLLLAVRRRHFREASTVAVLMGVMILGFAALGPVLLRRPNMWELPIGAGYCFAMIMLGAIWCSLHSVRRNPWFAAAGLALGLAIASRPTYLIASPLLAVPLFHWWWSERRIPWRSALCAGVPLAAIGLLMAGHNYARFDDPLQFGQAYQLSLDYESKMAHFRASHVPFNVWRYFFSAAQWSPYFPFIHPAELPPKPPGFGGHDDVYGVLRNLPFGWLALLAPLALWRRESAERRLLGAWLASVAMLFAAMAGTLIFFFGSLARYQSDFTPALMILAVVGLLAMERWVRTRRALAWPVAAGAVTGTLAVYSLLFAVLFSVQLDGLLGENNPTKERELERKLNSVAAALGRILGVDYGPVEVAFQLPVKREAGDETLLTLGEPPRTDRVFIRYADERSVQIGFVHFDAPAALSRPLPLQGDQRHRLRLAAGALFPPAAHPFFAEQSPNEIRSRTRQLRIDLNDERLLEGYYRFVGGARTRAAGEAAVRPGERRFSGRMEAVRRSAVEPVPPGGEFFRVRFALPAKPAGGEHDALLEFGNGAERARLVWQRHAESHVRFAWSHVDATVASEPVTLDLARVHSLTLKFEPAGKAGRRRLILSLDTTIYLSREVSVPADFGAPPRSAAEFAGQVFEIRAGNGGTDPLWSGGSTVQLRLRWPREKVGSREPLLVTGQNGGGDLLIVEYLDAQRVRFGLDHWGAPLLHSGPVAIDRSREQTVVIDFGSLEKVGDPDQARHVRRSGVTVTIDGVQVWQQESEFYVAEDAEIAIGRNVIGGTSCEAIFSGDVLSAERVNRP